jgi:hypothetical protein
VMVQSRRVVKLQSAPFLGTSQQESYSYRKMKITQRGRSLEKPLSTTTDEAARNTASPDISVGLPPPPAVDNDDVDVNTDPLTDTQPNTEATRATGRWTIDEDAELTRAVANTSKKWWGIEYKTDWDAVATLVPGRSRSQCRNRWNDILDPSIDRATGGTVNGQKMKTAN